MQGGSDPSGIVCCSGIIIFAVLIIYLLVKAGNEQTKKLYSARDDYYLALARLKKTLQTQI